VRPPLEIGEKGGELWFIRWEKGAQRIRKRGLRQFRAGKKVFEKEMGGRVRVQGTEKKRGGRSTFLRKGGGKIRGRETTNRGKKFFRCLRRSVQ